MQTNHVWNRHGSVQNSGALQGIQQRGGYRCHWDAGARVQHSTAGKSVVWNEGRRLLVSKGKQEATWATTATCQKTHAPPKQLIATQASATSQETRSHQHGFVAHRLLTAEEKNSTTAISPKTSDTSLATIYIHDSFRHRILWDRVTNCRFHQGFVKRSAVFFFVSTRLTDLQNVFCSKKIDQHRMLLRLDVSTIFHCVLLHRLPYCDHLRRSSCSARWCASSSTLNARCPATGMNESAEEDDPYASPASKPSASKSSLGRRHSIEVCPTRTLDNPYSFCRVVSRGDQQEAMNLDLAALDSPLEIASRLSSSASRTVVAFAAFAFSSGSGISFWRFTCGPSMFAFPLDTT